jgi:hypothetical protein
VSTSPSQIDKARGCIRVVAWDYVDPQEFVQGEAAALGDEVHDKLEIYNKCGADPSDGSIPGALAVLALPYAPRARTGQSEGFVRWTPKGEKVTFSMRVDWAGRAEDVNRLPPDVDPNMPITIDYKTSGDPSYGVWGEEAHYQDTQSLVYAAHRIAVTGADRVYNRWLYVRTAAKKKKPAAMPSDQVMERARVEAQMQRLVLPIGRKLEELQAEAKAGRLNVLSLPANPRQCKKYMRRDGTGVCPRYEQCNLSPADEMAGMEGEDRYMDDLLAMLQKPTAPAAPAATQPAPAAVAPVTINPAPVAPAARLDDMLAGSGSVAVDTIQAQGTSTPAARIATAVAIVDKSLAGDAITAEEIGRVVRFLFGR